MKLNRLKFFIFLTLFGAVRPSFAADSGGTKGRAEGFYFEETFFPVFVSRNDEENDAGGSATRDVPTQTGWGIDTRTTLAYVWNRVLLGATFNYYNVRSSRPRTEDLEGMKEVTDKQELGPTLGFLGGRWRLTATYFLTATKTLTQKYTDQVTGAVTTDETRKNKGGSGYQVAVGYDFQLGAGVGISPTLIYREVRYAKQSYTVRTGTGTPYTTTELRTEALDHELKPMITLNWIF